MVNWKYLLLAQYPALALLALLFLVNYLLVRKRSAVKSVLWVLFFGIALAAAVLFAFLGVHYEFWLLKELFIIGFAGWLGLILVVLATVAHIVHGAEKVHSRKVMEKELRRAAKEKDDAVAQAEEAGREAARQAHEEGRILARQEAEAERLAYAASTAESEARDSALAHEAGAPIELKLDGSNPPDEYSFGVSTEE